MKLVNSHLKRFEMMGMIKLSLDALLDINNQLDQI